MTDGCWEFSVTINHVDALTSTEVNLEEEEERQRCFVECIVCVFEIRSVCILSQLHGYTGYKRTGCVKPGSVKLAMGHLLHSETAP